MTATIDTLHTFPTQRDAHPGGAASALETGPVAAPGIDACPARGWGRRGAAWAIPPAAPSAGGRFRAVSTWLEEAIERRDRRLAARLRLRRLVDDIDMTIAACEHVHLAGAHQVTAELAAGAREVWGEAAEVFGELGDRDARQLVERVSSARAIWVHELMDRLWAVQDAAFDLLVPWRRRLRDSERDGEEEAPWSDGVPA